MLRRKNKQPKLKKRQVGRRSTADRVIAQGGGKAVQKAFGATVAKGYSMCGWDAFHPNHTPLPRAVGPYTVVRTTTLVSTAAAQIIFGTFQRNGDSQSDPMWTNTCAIFPLDPSKPIDEVSNTQLVSSNVPVPEGQGNTLCPAAFSVQLVNGNALQTTSGIALEAVSHTQMNLGGDTRTWSELGSEFVAYMRPRVLPAGKLALRGTQADAYPLNMSACSEFTPYITTAGGSSTWLGNQALGRDSIRPVGWSPIVVVNPSQIELTFLVSTEWRVRFDISSPAVASHRNHGVSSDQQWAKMIQTAVQRGNGVLDIVERVANIGMAASTAMARFAA